MRSPETTSFSEFQENLDAHFRRLGTAKRPTVVLRRGKAAAFVLSPKQFAAYADAREFMDTVRAVQESRRQIQAGRGKPAAKAKKDLFAKLGIGRGSRSR